MAWSAAKGPNSKQNGMKPTSYAEEFEVCRRSYSFREMGSKQMQQYFLLPAEVCLIAMTTGEKDPFNTAFFNASLFLPCCLPFFFFTKVNWGLYVFFRQQCYIENHYLYKQLNIDV